MAERSSHPRDTLTRKPQNINSLALYRKSLLPLPALGCEVSEGRTTCHQYRDRDRCVPEGDEASGRVSQEVALELSSSGPADDLPGEELGEGHSWQRDSPWKDAWTRQVLC